jgi:predicted heme/steroid binding protein
MMFETGGTERMRISGSNGYVGIGTTNPSQKLEVVGGEIKAGRVDSSNEGGQLSFGRASDNNTAWYIDAYGNAASPQLRFVNVDNAVVAMTITGSSVGIGTSSPAYTLDVNGTGRFSGALTSTGAITTNSNFINSGPVYSTTGNVGNLLFTNTYPANYNVAQIASVLDGYYYAAKLIFRTADYTNANLLVDRLTITSDGNIAIGTFATAGDKYFGYSHTNGGWGAGASGLRFESVSVGGNYSQSIYIRTHYYNADSRNAIYCRYDGNVYNFSNSTAWQTTSDIRIKENIRPINNALDKINALNPSHFEYKNKLGQTKTGFVAQEFEQIFPGHVSEGLPNEDYREYFEEGEMMKSIDADLIPYLVKAIQELSAKVTALEMK